MRGLIRLLVTSLLISFSTLGIAQEKYEISGKVFDIRMLKGDWDGKHALPSVYCVEFAQPDKAKSLQHAFMKGGAIYLVHVAYPGHLVGTIAVSTVPAEQTTKEAYLKMLDNERRSADKLNEAGIRYLVEEGVGDFGPTIEIVANNPKDGNKMGPFPLTRSFFSPADKSLVSMSVHRLFVRGHDRIEVAFIQPAPQPNTETTEAEMEASLTQRVNELVSSLQACTSTIPVRVPK
ncbi:MAG: hypothetical protein ABW120_07045 [Sedimenticola sp.]